MEKYNFRLKKRLFSNRCLQKCWPRISIGENDKEMANTRVHTIKWDDFDLSLRNITVFYLTLLRCLGYADGNPSIPIVGFDFA